MANLVNVDVGGVVGGLFKLIDQLFTSDEEKANARLKVLELQSKGELAQVAVNMKEAEHSSWFVAGWRPFIGWVCGLAFTWHFVLLPIVSALLIALGIPFVPPGFDMSALMTVLGGMLGIGGLRTYEKVQGVARERLDRRANGGNT